MTLRKSIRVPVVEGLYRNLTVTEFERRESGWPMTLSARFDIHEDPKSQHTVLFCSILIQEGYIPCLANWILEKRTCKSCILGLIYLLRRLSTGGKSETVPHVVNIESRIFAPPDTS